MEYPTNQDARAMRQTNLSRRRFLRGAGACIALPAFQSLLTSRALAAVAPAAAGPLAVTKTGAPLRMAFVYFPNGAHQGHWWPTAGEGNELELSRTLAPLANVKKQIQVLGGMDQINATAGRDGPGDHARASGTFLTGVRARKTAGADISVGVSIDQLAAQHVGHLTRFPSLELSCDAVRKSGSCDSGYSCAYQFNLSWQSPTTPVAPEPNPRLLFERMFGAGEHGQRSRSLQQRQQQQRSILDFVMQDARDLQTELAARDKQKLDEYLTGIRDLEKRIERSEKFKDTPDPAIATPAGVPTDFQEYIRIQYSMMLLAFQTDSTRIATFLLAHEGSNRPFPEINIAEGHHYLSHHGGKTDMMNKIADIDLFYAKQFAWFLEQLAAAKDVDGNSILHNSMIVYGSGNGDGNRHTHTNLPVILAGNGGGTLNPGRLNRFRPTPMSNMLISLAERMGVQNIARFGDSTGRAEGL